MVPEAPVITGELCGTACFLAVVATGFVLFLKRLKLSKLSAAQQDAGRKPPPDTEPETAVPAGDIGAGNPPAKVWPAA